MFMSVQVHSFEFEFELKYWAGSTADVPRDHEYVQVRTFMNMSSVTCVYAFTGTYTQIIVKLRLSGIVCVIVSCNRMCELAVYIAICMCKPCMFFVSHNYVST